MFTIIKRFRATGVVADWRSTRPRKKLMDEHYRFINDAEDDELTAAKMLSLLQEKFLTLNVSVRTVKRARKELGWTAKKTRRTYIEIEPRTKDGQDL